MEQCNKCIFYDEEYDELRRSGNDIVIPNTPIDKHYCRMYDSYIDDAIVKDKKECEFFTT